jgi:hypothetical protein
MDGHKYVEAILIYVCALLTNFRSVASGRRYGELYARGKMSRSSIILQVSAW